MVDERAQHERAALHGDAAETGDAVDADEAAGQGELALARADDEVGAARDRASSGGQRGEGLVQRVCCRVAHEPTSCMCSQTRSGVIGSLRSGAPVSL